ncbi:MAG: tRNA glutamyl-Q(34) synthetase GluQRS [Myxococcales bacterium]|nr:tRNA glutamyl-Q(34) synthetase GluQRS [Myxococcales bacterium]MCB9749461.1 tRNA glutamyl-Q(34) synthetase GluQRS [Myxococcales bacterium]
MSTPSAAAPHRGRYAPSPTGRLHLGNARTALLAWLYTRQQGGRFVLRIEDNDPTRSRPELEERVYRDLAWMGLDWDEGPDVGGPFGPYRQSERLSHYERAIAGLSTYACSCSRRELRTRARFSPGGEVIYPGTCRSGPVAAGRPTALRWRAPPGRVSVDDLVHGPDAARDDIARDVGDFVLRRSDGAWAYQLAVVVDDAAMQITDVVRGDDLLHCTPRQVHLLRALGHPPPRYAHVPLIFGPDGQKLSKRHGAPDLSALREGGATPERTVAALARSVGLWPATAPAISARALLAELPPVFSARLRDAPLELETLA